MLLVYRPNFCVQGDASPDNTKRIKIYGFFVNTRFFWGERGNWMHVPVYVYGLLLAGLHCG